MRVSTFVAFFNLNYCGLLSDLFQLLEDHIKQIKASKEDGSDAEMDEEEDWEGWEVASDSSESSSGSEGWIDVSSDSDKELDISDSEDEKIAEGKEMHEKDKDIAGKDDEKPENTDAVPSIATTKVRFPDFKLRILY